MIQWPFSKKKDEIHLQNIKILLLTNNASDIKHFNKYLDQGNSQDYILSHVNNLDQGLKIIQECTFDIFLVDLKLKDSAGLQNYEKIRATSPHIPIIVKTDPKNEKTAIKAISKGAEGYLLNGQVDENVFKHAVIFAIERNRVEQQLRESEQRYRIMADNSPVMIWGAGTDGQFTFLNKRWLDFKGRKMGEELGEGWMQGIYKEDITRYLRKYIEAFKSRKIFRLEYRMKRNDGQYRWVLNTGIPRFGPNNKFLGYVGSCVDITELKMAEEKLNRYSTELEEQVEKRTVQLKTINKRLKQEITHHEQTERELKVSREELRSLSSHLQAVREEERSRIAREIHDELGQILTALRMDLFWLKDHLPKRSKLLTNKTEDMFQLVATTMNTVQRLTAELRPGILDDLGLAAALEWQAKQFQNRSGISCNVLHGFEDIDLDQETSTAIFRAFQETLTNVARHAQATKVEATLKKASGLINLEVKDNGKGILMKKINDVNSLGLIGIRERAHSLSGDFEIKRNGRKGTVVRVTLPISLKSQSNA